MIGDIIGFIVLGAIIGALARLVLPGKQDIGWAATIIIGIIGAFVGGLITRAIVGDDHRWIGYVVSIAIGALGVAVYAGMEAKKVRSTLPTDLSGNSRAS
ncbi:GlsB/YeaQ/YmgE family stress response membrane protein [Luteipulveratus mongoliensis]|uniref:Transglycosylase n=1 Tax=Luteipulveratus mongoliensis TaxID=571913 RepID=A0A0K1JM01_9MICO|nr:GlsB/YeaQ/YmgE family stress response membrane protein [Luteipulveratus mongoliensis]AKU17620.1 hypothetical protein VV02_20185 [Luteipulveratus mongoliensis]